MSKTKIKIIALVAVALVAVVSVVGYAQSAPSLINQIVNLLPGDTVVVNCPSRLVSVSVTNNRISATCRAVSTATPTRTPVPPTATPVPPTATVVVPPTSTAPSSGYQPWEVWHAPGAHVLSDGSMSNPHEHGDAPPVWANDFSVAQFGHPIIYGGDENSGVMENSMKHQAYKGVAYRTMQGSSCYVDVYLRYHAASNPLDRASAFHSYELYMRDCQGGISIRQGLYWVGYPEFRSQRMSRYNEEPGTLLPDGSIAPGRDQFIISAPDNRDWFGLNGIIQKRCEQWYASAGDVGGEFGITICAATTLFNYDEHLTNVHDRSTWNLTGDTGLARRIEISLYGVNSTVPTNQPAGWFCSTKFPIEDRVEGSTHHPRWTLITNGVDAPTDCVAGYLPQFTAPTFPNTGIYFLYGNALDMKTFPGGGIVTVPN